jgi:gamma-glutamylcysteine synthetase
VEEIMDISELVKINELYSQAVVSYEENGKNEYDSGIVEGIKRVIEIIEVDPA